MTAILSWLFISLAVRQALAPRSAAPRIPNDIDLLNYTTLSHRIVVLYNRALADFEQWLGKNGCDIEFNLLLNVPLLMARLLPHYGAHLYRDGFPMYMYMCTITAIEIASPQCTGQLKAAWQLLDKWRVLRPVTHRVPLPFVIFSAVLSVAIALGWVRLAGCFIIAFVGPTRISEAINALRKHLILPPDVLEESWEKAYLHVSKPKTS